MGAIGNCHPAGAPEPWQGKACKGVDQIGRCGFEFWCVDMLSVDPPQRLGGSDARGMSGGLAGSEIAAVAEHCENIALFWPGKFGVCAGGWPEVASVAGPACAVFDNVEQVPFRHASVDFRLESGQAGGLGSGGLGSRGVGSRGGGGRGGGVRVGGGRWGGVLRWGGPRFRGLRLGGLVLGGGGGGGRAG